MHYLLRKTVNTSAVLALCAALACLSACATGAKLSDAEKLSLYRAHAGAPVSSFRYFGRIDSWTALGDSAIAVWTRPMQAYLLDLGGSCPEIDTAFAITLTDQMGTVSARFDKVMPHGPGASGTQIPCVIREIRPLDPNAIKQAERSARDKKAQASGT